MYSAWVPMTLGDLITLEYGRALPEAERDGIGNPVYGSNGVVGWHSQPLVPGPGIIVGRKGTAGSVTWCDSNFTPIDTAYWVQLRDHSSVLPRFLALLLWAADLPDICAQTGVPGLNRERAYDIRVMLPPLFDQQRIVDLIGVLDVLAAAADEEAVLARNALVSLGESVWHRPGIQTVALDSLGRIITGSTPKTNDAKNWSSEDVPFLTPGDLRELGFVTATSRCVSQYGANSGRRIPGGSVAVVCIGATIGKIGLTTGEVITNQQINTVVGLRETDAQALALILSSPSGRGQLLAASGQTAVPILNKSAFGRTVVPWPDECERLTLGELTGEALMLNKALEAEGRALRGLRRSLVKALLGGFIEIPDSYDAVLAEAV